MKIDWQQCYRQSQTIRSDEKNISVERIRRLISLYKSDLIDNELQQYRQNLKSIKTACLSCTPKSSIAFQWNQGYILSVIDLLDVHLAGRSTSPFVYFWKKKSIDHDEKFNDFQSDRHSRTKSDSSSSFSTESSIVNWICRISQSLIKRLQMYYVDRRVRSERTSLKVHQQYLKCFRSFFRQKMSPIFIGFVDENTTIDDWFWTFRHFIHVLNWPFTSKIVSCCSDKKRSITERWLMNVLGFIDLSFSNIDQSMMNLKQSLKTAKLTGPILLLFDKRKLFDSSSMNFYVMNFLVDLVRFDYLMPDLLFIPSLMNRSEFSFGAPFLLKEYFDNVLENPLMKMKNQNEFTSLITFLLCHLVYDANHSVSSMPAVRCLTEKIESMLNDKNQKISTDAILQHCFSTQSVNVFQSNDEKKFTSIDQIENFDFLRELRNEYHHEILSALAILSKIKRTDFVSIILGSAFIDEIAFVYNTFTDKESFVMRPCQTVAEIIKECQSKNYIQLEHRYQKPYKYCSDIFYNDQSSDDSDVDLFNNNDLHEISSNDDSLDEDEFYYCINTSQFYLRFQFFASWLCPILQAMISILNDHIDNQRNIFIFDDETSCDPELFRSIRRAYAYETNSSKEFSLLQDFSDQPVPSLTMDRLISLRDRLVHLYDCCSKEENQS